MTTGIVRKKHAYKAVARGDAIEVPVCLTVFPLGCAASIDTPNAAKST